MIRGTGALGGGEELCQEATRRRVGRRGGDAPWGGDGGLPGGGGPWDGTAARRTAGRRRAVGVGGGAPGGGEAAVVGEKFVGVAVGSSG